MNCQEAVSSIHEYLDGQLDRAGQEALERHLTVCESCRGRLRSLEMTEAWVRTLKDQDAPDMTDRIMSSLPAARKRQKFARWLKRHPALVAGVLFIVVMFSSFATMWNTNEVLTVRTNEMDKIIVEGNRVIVPADQTIHGDLIVENGEIIVEGLVTGNLVVIDGKYTASSANVAGRITLVNRIFDWLWYKIAGLFGTV
mgnify:CR=1 FL=1